MHAHTRTRIPCTHVIHVKIFEHVRFEKKKGRSIDTYCKKTDPLTEKSADCYLLRALPFFRNGITLNVYGALTIHHLSPLIDMDSDTWLAEFQKNERGAETQEG
jgi:hypothetical protein